MASVRNEPQQTALVQLQRTLHLWEPAVPIIDSLYSVARAGMVVEDRLGYVERAYLPFRHLRGKCSAKIVQDEVWSVGQTSSERPHGVRQIVKGHA